ncbi:MAG TPA: hypothetical protein ENH46_00640 [Candidatus Pacearchaeota archaeon]|nr:hypothetical protein [Candidatus Pacearchaeota archaeon]
MPKTDIIPCTKEEMDKLIEASIDDDFYYMIFNVAKTTGRRLGELYGNQKKKEIGRKKIGKRIVYIDGKQTAIDVNRTIYKKIPNQWDGGVKVKDIDFDENLMKIWVLKRGKAIQDESILTNEVKKIIKHYILKNNLKENDYLFRGKTYRAIQEAVTRYYKKGEINHKVSFHNFRHFFVTELKRKGWTNDEIMKLTGHKSARVLTIYDHVVASDIKDKALHDLKDL